MVDVKVKPLEWHDHGPDSSPEPAWSAQTPFGFYNIEEVSASDSPAYVVRLHAHHFLGDMESLDDAKAAAQADFERRILSALTTPEAEPVAWASSKDWRKNQLMSAAQYNSALPKNRADFDIPLFTHPSPSITDAEVTDAMVYAAVRSWREHMTFNLEDAMREALTASSKARGQG